jgi:hypothetical protein
MTKGRDGTVFIAEDYDPEDFGTLTGRFSAIWQGERGYRQGPEGVSAEEAIAWGRSQADKVVIRLGDSDVEYSAGNRPPDRGPGKRLPVWPEGRVVPRRRLPGMEHLDLVTEAPIEWTVRLPHLLHREPGPALAERLRSGLAADTAASQPRVDLERDDQGQLCAVFRFTVRARSHPEALQLVLAIAKRTIDPSTLCNAISQTRDPEAGSR